MLTVSVMAQCAHLEENLAAASIALNSQEMTILDQLQTN